MPAEILFPVISDLIDPATDQKGNATDETEKDPTPSMEDR